jgi:aspartate aminotransferase-like enzyme
MIGSAMAYAWKEREELAKAERDIAEGERLVAEQVLRIGWMARRGHDTREAETLLRNYEQPLEQLRRHQQLILDEIRRQEGSKP